MGKPVVYFGFPTSQFQACVCVTPGNVIQAYVWADSSLQHFVKGASGMHVEISQSSACPWSKGQNESLLQLSSVTFTAVCVQPLVTKEDQSPYAEVSLCEPHLVPSWEAGHLSVTRTVSREGYEESRLNFYSHSSERKWWKPCFLHEQCLCCVGFLSVQTPTSYEVAPERSSGCDGLRVRRRNEKYPLAKKNKKGKTMGKLKFILDTIRVCDYPVVSQLELYFLVLFHILLVLFPPGPRWTDMSTD